MPPFTTVAPTGGSCWRNRWCDLLCEGWKRDGGVVLTVLAFFGFGAAVLFLGPIFGLLYFMFLLSVMLVARELRSRCEASTIHPQSEEPTQASTGVVVKAVVDVSSLVVRTIQADEPTQLTCEICLEDVLEGQELAGSPNPDCIHEFHVHCIYQALQRQTTCPCCRREYLLPEEEEALVDVDVDVDPDLDAVVPDIELGVVPIDPVVLPARERTSAGQEAS